MMLKIIKLSTYDSAMILRWALQGHYGPLVLFIKAILLVLIWITSACQAIQMSTYYICFYKEVDKSTQVFWNCLTVHLQGYVL